MKIKRSLNDRCMKCSLQDSLGSYFQIQNEGSMGNMLNIRKITLFTFFFILFLLNEYDKKLKKYLQTFYSLCYKWTVLIYQIEELLLSLLIISVFKTGRQSVNQTRQAKQGLSELRKKPGFSQI